MPGRVKTMAAGLDEGHAKELDFLGIGAGREEIVSA